MSTDDQSAYQFGSSKQLMRGDRDRALNHLRILLEQIDSLEYVEFCRDTHKAEFMWDQAVERARTFLASFKKDVK